jgi:branched-chain amino acid transport system permease protein
VGAAVYTVLDTIITKYTDYWQAVLGGILVLLVILFPHGLLGVLPDRPAWRRAGRG